MRNPSMAWVCGSCLVAAVVIAEQPRAPVFAAGGRWITFSTSTISGVSVGTDNPQALALVDVNKKLPDDLLVVDNINNLVNVYINDGNGSFPNRPASFGVGDGPVAVTAADANQDNAVTVDDIIAAVFNVLHGCAQFPRCLPGGRFCTRSDDCCSLVCFSGTHSCL